MKIIARKKGESIKVGDDVIITVCSVRPGAVRLGVTAPVTKAIHRRDNEKEDTCQKKST